MAWAAGAAENRFMIIDQRIAVFGGTSGIGLAVAEAFADAGAEVLVAGRQPGKLEDALSRIRGNAHGAIVDVREEEDIARFFDAAGELDHVVSTVGATCQPARAQSIDRADAQELFSVKYWGQLFIAKHAAPRLAARGSITLTSGILSSRPEEGFSLLASLNAGVEALVRTLALEFAPLRVNAVCPGFIDTNKLFPELTGEAREARLLEEKGNALPTKRVGLPRDAVKAYLYALGNSYVTGQTLTVDGGASLR